MTRSSALPSLSPGVSVIDSHCHLDEARFGSDRDAVIARALDASVSRMVTIGASEQMRSNYGAVALAAQHAAIFATVGVHPHDASIVSPAVIEEVARLAGSPKVVGIGETGLDYYYDNSPRAAQQQAFRDFVSVARRLRLPLVIHLRDAYDEAVAIMREEHAAEVGGVIHCFSGDRSAARAFLDLGFHLSFSGIVTFKNADELRAVARMVPEDRFMVETDAPFLTPVPLRGKRNEPAYVLFTAAALGTVRQQPLDEIAALASANAARCFRLPGPEP
ncbi:MAG TPA: TatD family hydrolase [Candidatus Acidoferrales bacterium]|nr:TatD family hydrolase [Candidatus Acidoferrales bacterium]